MITVNVLIAPPGCNKEALGKLYAKVNNFKCVSSQIVIKDYKKNVRNYHKEAQHWMGKDQLIPTWMIYHEVMDELFKWGFKEDRVLVGYPRTRQQAEILYKRTIKSIQYQLGEVLFIDREKVDNTTKDYELYYENLGELEHYFKNIVSSNVRHLQYETLKEEDLKFLQLVA